MLSLTIIGSIFIHLAVVASQICEILRNRQKNRTNNSSRLSKVIDLGTNRKRICNFLLVINSNFGRTVFKILTHLDRKYLAFPTTPLFDAA